MQFPSINLHCFLLHGCIVSYRNFIKHLAGRKQPKKKGRSLRNISLGRGWRPWARCHEGRDDGERQPSLSSSVLSYIGGVCAPHYLLAISALHARTTPSRQHAHNKSHSLENTVEFCSSFVTWNLVSLFVTYSHESS